MSTAEYLKMTEMIMVLADKFNDAQIIAAVNQEKTTTALKQIDEKVDDVKENVEDLSKKLEALSVRFEKHEADKSAFSSVKDFVSNGFGFFQKYYRLVLVTIILFVVLFGGSLGLDVGAIVPVIMGLFGL